MRVYTYEIDTYHKTVRSGSEEYERGQYSTLGDNDSDNLLERATYNHNGLEKIVAYSAVSSNEAQRLATEKFKEVVERFLSCVRLLG